MSPQHPRHEEILVEVFREQRLRLWGFFSRGGAAAEDLLQETFLRAWDHRDRLAGGSPGDEREGCRRFLWRIARNLVIDEIRTRQRRRELLPAAGEPPEAAPGHAERLEMEDAARAVRQTVETLPDERTRACLMLWLDGKDVGSIAREVSLGTGQVRGLLQRGRGEVVRRAAARFKASPERPRGEEGDHR